MFLIDISYLEFGTRAPPETTACLICLRHLSKSVEWDSPIDTLEFFSKIVNSADHLRHMRRQNHFLPEFRKLFHEGLTAHSHAGVNGKCCGFLCPFAEVNSVCVCTH